MRTEEFTEAVESFLNGELPKEKEEDLFDLLKKNGEAREYFRNSLALKKSMEIAAEALPSKVDEKILNSVLSKKESYNPLYSRAKNLLVYGIAVAAVVIAVLFFSMLYNYHNELKRTREIVETQSKTLELLINSLPTANVSYKFKNQATVYKNL